MTTTATTTAIDPAAAMSELGDALTAFSRIYEVSALDLFACIRDELSLHEPQLQGERADYIAECIVRRINRDVPA